MSGPKNSLPAPAPDCTVVSERFLSFAPADVYAAFADPVQLARWWGPAGFTNTVQEFDLRPGGAWRITMHGPGGAAYPNESEFLEVTPPSRLVFVHLGPMHRYWMIMTFAPEGAGTRLSWHMQFETAAEIARIGDFIAQANQENFDRLSAVLSESHPPVR
jgi:uncharacterized protein YndB with AHSA1/START domain